MMPDSREGGILGAAILPLALWASLTRRREEREKGRQTTGEETETRSARLWLPQPASLRSRGAARQRARD
ncbi:rCG59798 [Rattus norvegicus]|uniref:RCG59798 n=1 Tax=Rattus norvegicus TaxID=10116 RepID=A6HTE1_RAT|nr:rCG59798 [Rattus norvegicus]